MMDTDFLEERLGEAGELHLVLEEHDAISLPDGEYVGIRSGNTEFRDGIVVVDDGRTEHYIKPESIIYATPATEFPD